MRTSIDQFEAGRIINGFDYRLQCWIKDGYVVRCGHPAEMQCNCYGRSHEGEPSRVV